MVISLSTQPKHKHIQPNPKSARTAYPPNPHGSQGRLLPALMFLRVAPARPGPRANCLHTGFYLELRKSGTMWGMRPEPFPGFLSSK